MKTMLPVLVIALLIASCSSNPYRSELGTSAPKTAVDTVGLAEFNNWKLEKSQNVIDSKKESVDKVSDKRRASSGKTNRAIKNNEPPVTYESRSSESENAALPAEKKGWSKAAKGAVIGAGSGAVAGAVIHKRNRVVGGVIGAVVGAGAGYGIGRHMDKKDGRY